MYERYPISGIKQSYRHTPRTRTIVMPLLIVALLGGMAWFYVSSDPAKRAALENLNSHIVPEAFAENSSPPELFPIQAEAAETRVAAKTESAPTSSRSASPERPPKALPFPEESTLGPDFTPWLSPLALDSYMRTKDQGHQVGFWDRGHWMTSIEGRWKDGSHEFRIRYAETPKTPGWKWEYRINLTPEQFLETHAQMRDAGFSLVSSQSFLHPDQRRRYQAVWQSHPIPNRITSLQAPSTEVASSDEVNGPPASLRFIPAPAGATPPERLFGERTEATPQLVTSPQSGGALDVNRLEFRQ
ncbi:MAG: hypothetical protein P1U85_17060 [Verrucomicrobiales bacterium]|nr:hypothetical protein [Verrucomicrobiales bacterium]